MISVNQIDCFERFVACLKLRYRTYRGLGYLKHNRPSDLDKFDWSSIHLEAVDASGSLVGVVRLVLPAATREFVDIQETGLWCDRVNEQEQLGIQPSASLPIWDTIAQNQISIGSLMCKNPGEMSRIIVSPDSRGKGVARKLAESIAARASSSGCDAVVLQCLPNHVQFFNRLDYVELIDSLNYTHLCVPERVVAMRRSVKA